MNTHAEPKLETRCWICGKAADTAEHRFKATDIRRAIRLSQRQPAYLQINLQATNKEIGSAKAKALQFSKSLCGYCNSTRTQPYDRAWERLSEYIRANWREIRRRRSLDLTVPFPGALESGALNVHLFFLKLFGCKAVQDREPIDISTLATCLMDNKAHPEISLYVANSASRTRGILAFESDVYKMWHQAPRRLDGALWSYVVPPIAVKVCYIRTGAPLFSRGHPWHPSQRRQFVRLSPYQGAIDSIPGRAVER
jgi:hypothetical protein